MSTDLTRTIRALVEAPPKPVKALRWLLGLAIGLIALAPLVSCLASVFASIVRTDPSSLLFVAAPLALLLCYPALSHRLADWRQRRALQQELERHLLLSGASPSADDPRALALRAEFWQRTQRQALEDLRRRLEQTPQPADLLVMMWRSLKRFRAVILIAGSVWGAVTGLMFCGAATRPTHEVGDSALAMLTLFAVSFVFVIFYLLVLAASTGIVEERIKRRELRRETHRVVNLIETAGGLSLAEGEVRGLLQGAIEPAGAAGGELELRDPALEGVLPSGRGVP